MRARRDCQGLPRTTWELRTITDYPATLMFLKPHACLFRSTIKNAGVTSLILIRAPLIFPSKNSPRKELSVR